MPLGGSLAPSARFVSIHHYHHYHHNHHDRHLHHRPCYTLKIILMFLIVFIAIMIFPPRTGQTWERAGYTGSGKLVTFRSLFCSTFSFYQFFA